MAMPTYEEAMIPVLKALVGHDMRARRDVREAVADSFDLTPEERTALLPSGATLRIASRVGWAMSYLKQAGLVETPRRGHYRITPLGSTTLAQHPGGIGASYLEQFEQFRAFQERTRRPTDTSVDGPIRLDEVTSAASPEEDLDDAFVRLRANVQQELIEAAKSSSPSFFEQLVVDLLVKMGYGGSRPEAARAVGRSGDGGIDGVIDEDRLGLDTIYVQAKRWENVVGRPEIQKFAGALQGHRAKKGIFITTSAFTREATEYVDRIDARIILIDGQRLAGLMFDFDVGVATRTVYPVKTVNSEYFEG